MSVKLLIEQGAAQARLSLHLSKFHIVGNHISTHFLFFTSQCVEHSGSVGTGFDRGMMHCWVPTCSGNHGKLENH